jgi:signal transduction histidine kinase
MGYNTSMKIITPRSDAVRMIRLAAFLLLGYVIVLILINELFQTIQSPQFPQRPFLQQFPQQNINFLYLGLYGCIAIICLVLAYWPLLQGKLKQAFIPVVISITTISPFIINHFAGRLSPLGPRFGSPEATVLAMFPFLFVALLLVAWQYKWHHVLLVIAGITALNLGSKWASAGPGTDPFQGVLSVTLIQTIIFLVVGFSISYLMSRLRAQQQSLEAANRRLTQYASTLEQLATSRERNRLALELHDTLAHTLSGLSVQLETVKAYWDVDQRTARSTLDKSLAATHSGLEETRRALKSLRASPLEDMGLALALRKMVEDTASRANLALDMPDIIMMQLLSPEVEHCIYRVAQEAVTNVMKHANAKKMTVKLESAGGKTILSVSDDGTGFNVDAVDKTSHFGLAGMQERAQMAGGELSVTSKPGSGTTVKLTVNQAERL